MRIPRPLSHVGLTSRASPSPFLLLSTLLFLLLTLFPATAEAEAETSTNTLSTTTTRTSTYTVTMTRPQQHMHAIVMTTVATTTLGTTVLGGGGAAATRTSAPETSAVASANQESYSDAARFKEVILDGTNAVRGNHNASRLVWNETLAAFAQDWVAACGFRHSNGPYGENLATNYANTSAAVTAWANEAAAFDFQDPGFSKQTGHFSQLVWKGTTSVGCARKDCSNSDGDASGWYVVCEYAPRGNVAGAYGGNVQAAVGGVEEGEGGRKTCGMVGAEMGCIEAHKNGAAVRGAGWGLGMGWGVLVVMGSAGCAAVGW